MDGKIVNGPRERQGNTPLGVPEVAGNVWTVYRLGGGWEIGGGVRGQTGTWLTDANLPGSQIPGYVAARRDGRLRAAEVRGPRSTATTSTDKTYYIGGYKNSPNRVLPGAAASTAT